MNITPQIIAIGELASKEHLTEQFSAVINNLVCRVCSQANNDCRHHASRLLTNLHQRGLISPKEQTNIIQSCINAINRERISLPNKRHCFSSDDEYKDFLHFDKQD